MKKLIIKMRDCTVPISIKAIIQSIPNVSSVTVLNLFTLAQNKVITEIKRVVHPSLNNIIIKNSLVSTNIEKFLSIKQHISTLNEDVYQISMIKPVSTILNIANLNENASSIMLGRLRKIGDMDVDNGVDVKISFFDNLSLENLDFIVN